MVIDLSNVAQGATKNEKGALHGVALAQVLELGAQSRSNPGERSVAGSMKMNTSEPSVFRLLRERGYNPFVEELSADGRETEVDSWLHHQILRIVRELSRTARPGTNTLVLATGDGNNHDGVTSFPKVVLEAVQRGFRVEVWAWMDICSKKFKELQRRFPSQVTLHDLRGAVSAA